MNKYIAIGKLKNNIRITCVVDYNYTENDFINDLKFNDFEYYVVMSEEEFTKYVNHGIVPFIIRFDMIHKVIDYMAKNQDIMIDKLNKAYW